MASASINGMFAASGEDVWKAVLSTDPERPWQRRITSADMARCSLTKRRLYDKSDPRYAAQYMRLKLQSRESRHSRSGSAESSLYEMEPDDVEWSKNPMHRWSRKRYSSYWPHQHHHRLEYHANSLRFPEANKPSMVQNSRGSHGSPEMVPEDWSPRDQTFQGSGWQRASITRGGEYSPNRRSGKLEAVKLSPRSPHHDRLHDDSLGPGGMSFASNMGGLLEIKQSDNLETDFSQDFSSFASSYDPAETEDAAWSIGMGHTTRGSRGYRLSSSADRRPQTTPATSGGRVMRVSRNVHFKGSYVNNRTRPTASRFNAPGFDFATAYEKAGFQNYRAGNFPSSPGSYERDLRKEGDIRNKNVAGHEWRRRRGNFFERRTEVVNHSSNGMWPEDWSPVGKLSRMQREHREAERNVNRRRQETELLWEKTMRRLRETRTYDDFHSSKFYTRGEDHRHTAANTGLARSGTADVGAGAAGGGGVPLTGCGGGAGSSVRAQERSVMKNLRINTSEDIIGGFGGPTSYADYTGGVEMNMKSGGSQTTGVSTTGPSTGTSKISTTPGGGGVGQTLAKSASQGLLMSDFNAGEFTRLNTEKSAINVFNRVNSPARLRAGEFTRLNTEKSAINVFNRVNSPARLAKEPLLIAKQHTVVL